MIHNVRPLRYISYNPGEEISASYNVGLGTKAAYGYAIDNARQRGGQVVCEYADGAFEVVKNYGRETVQNSA